MSITQRRSLDSNAIKLIAILAMTVDHIAWAVFPGYPRAALPLLMHLIGRITCPIMCYFIAEGFHYTHDVRKYTARLSFLHFFRTFAISMPRTTLSTGIRSSRSTTAVCSTRQA